MARLLREVAERPALVFVLCVAIGICVTFWLPGARWVLLAMFTAVAAPAVVSPVFRRRWGYPVIAVGFGAVGAFRYAASIGVPSGDISRLAPASVRVAGIVASSVTPDHAAGDPTELGARFVLDVRRLISRNGHPVNRPVAGSVFVRVPLRDTGETRSRRAPSPGEWIQTDGSIERPPGQRNPGGFDERQWLANQGVYAVMRVAFSFDWRVKRAPRWDLGALSARCNALLLSHARARMQPSDAQALAGILVGRRSEMAPAARDAFDRTGASHVLATAGLHVGLLALALVLLVRLAAAPRRAGLILVIATLALYAQMAGARAAVSRAVLLAALYLGAQLFEREPDAATALALAALILLVVRPANLFEVGFQLSFAVVITLALAARWMEATAVWFAKRRRRCTRIRRVFWGAGLVGCEAAMVAAAAQAGAAPLTAYYFHQVQVLSIPANTLVVPAVGPVMACASAASVTAIVSRQLARPLDGAAHLLLVWITGVLRACSGPWWASVGIAPPPPLVIAGAYGLLWWGLWRFGPKGGREVYSGDRRLERRAEAEPSGAVMGAVPAPPAADRSARPEPPRAEGEGG